MFNVVILGLGYIGLPTAALVASNKKKVLGVDVNPEIVKKVNEGKSHFVEPDLDNIIRESVKEGYLTASVKPQEADVFIIVVPTPFIESKKPDISYVEAATKSITPYLKKGDLVIIESTSPVGTTEKISQLIYSENPQLKDEIFISYCPERVLPGNIMHELVTNDRVIGGINENSTKEALKFYANFVEGKLHPTDDKTAEMCKLVENASRDVQIAFANELSLICADADINVWELIKLANRHPRVNILQPGSGVGGHCIAVDPYFITDQFPEVSKIIGLARDVNNYKASWCVEQIRKKEIEFKQTTDKNPRVALMGLAFKPNVDDLRESPAEFIVNKIVKENNEKQYFVVEPNIKKHERFEIINYKKAIDKSDIIVFLVAHEEFRELMLDGRKIVLDFCGVTS